MRIDVEDIKRLAINPGEVLVVRLHDGATKDDADRIASQVKARLPEGVEVLVTANVELSVLTRV